MLKVATRLGTSSVHGIGLFASQFIPQGTVTWEYDQRLDQVFSLEDLARMSEFSREQVLHYAYADKKTGGYVLCFDDQRFINHSRDPRRINITSTPDRDTAARDITIGEELFCDYNRFDDTYFERRNIEEGELL